MSASIGILGFGRFGQLMCRYLAKDFHVVVFDRRGRNELIGAHGAVTADIPETCQQEILILAVPISSLETVLREIGPHLTPPTTVVDVCSVKSLPVQWMEAHLPKEIAIYATHPMFGPDSAADTLDGQKIVVCPVRGPASFHPKAVQYLKSKGLEVIETTPDAHDRQIAVTLALTHFVGRSLAEYGAQPLQIDTDGYKRLLHTLEVVTHDTWQLFEDMNRFNPYAAKERRALLAATQKVAAQLRDDKGNPDG